jgi:hypothetical protein
MPLLLPRTLQQPQNQYQARLVLLCARPHRQQLLDCLAQQQQWQQQPQHRRHRQLLRRHLLPLQQPHHVQAPRTTLFTLLLLVSRYL